MMQTLTSSMSAWKNNALALLLLVDVDRGLEESSQDCIDRPDGLMKAAANSEGSGPERIKWILVVCIYAAMIFIRGLPRLNTHYFLRENNKNRM
jgi:hypothetical protein